MTDEPRKKTGKLNAEVDDLAAVEIKRPLAEKNGSICENPHKPIRVEGRR